MVNTKVGPLISYCTTALMEFFLGFEYKDKNTAGTHEVNVRKLINIITGNDTSNKNGDRVK